MKALSLFSGIGGIDLAGEWAGIETVAMCEREPFCQKVLKKHWPNVPIYDDVCTLTKERLEADGIGTIELIHGGYPCQPFSVAGKREGKNDDRHLWPEVYRLIQDIKPRWFVGENVAGHVTLGLDIVLADLENIGYEWETFVLPAAAVGANHQRERVFIVANSDSFSGLEANTKASSIGKGWKPRGYARWGDRAKASRFDRPVPEPAVQRMVNGVPRRLDEDKSRLKALGNAVVPQQIYPILAAIKHIDDML